MCSYLRDQLKIINIYTYIYSVIYEPHDNHKLKIYNRYTDSKKKESKHN